MTGSLSFLIGWRFRKGRRRSGMLSLVSVISTFSIALGIAALIIGLSAMNGFERELKTRILSVVPHGEVYSLGEPLHNWRSVQAQLNSQPHIVATAPYVEIVGLLENGNKLTAVQVKGVDPQQEEKISLLPQYVQNGAWQNFKSDQQQIIIGQGLADTLGVQEGSWVTLLIPVLNESQQLKPPKRVRVQIAGILNLTGNLGHKFALMPLEDAQKQTNMGDSVTGIIVNVDDVYQSYRLITQAVNNINDFVSMRSWEFEYGYMYRDIQMIRSIMYLSMILVIGVACFNIVSTLVIAVKDKQSDIAILKTLGADDRLIRRIFIWYGLIAGSIGSLVGVVLGIVASLQLSNIIKFIESLTGHKFLDSKIYFVDFLPSELQIKDVIIVFITAMILSLIASYYPARRACKIDPARVLSKS
ncbi:lipoprotein-releasing ABC transporter permease subunit LolE [Zophobihabitans entericus]|uniref:Lipoprotein-releasing ABC transporter permease subunit LolE n=1 Tax=Zophobihabitans entericus TaxID=1635327 RepID=A0A6G9ICX8_9GAMM|nr:lipoprotein-releasing ABC transporter permease subunit LolE [Zophobihabitans entericus]QIQ22085.1 lipoprotein-releasing ABC transporter permease subunit LolE [Zophobihabitans entericus]